MATSENTGTVEPTTNWSVGTILRVLLIVLCLWSSLNFFLPVLIAAIIAPFAASGLLWVLELVIGRNSD